LRDDKACFGRTTFSRLKSVASGRPEFFPPIKEKEVPGPLTPAKAAGNQIPVVNRVFTPSAADIPFAERVVGVFARAVGEGSAAIQVDGKLIGRHPYSCRPRPTTALRLARSALARRPSANGSALAEGPAGDRARQSPLYSE
jgi:hypothetical protein